MKQATHPFRVAIIGGGITGLRSAHCLARDALSSSSLTVSLFDAGPECGGVLQTFHHNGYQLEIAAQGVLSTRPGFARVVTELNLQNAVVRPSHKRLPRYLISKNNLVKMGPFPRTFVREGLLTWGGLLRAFAEVFIRKPTLPLPDETLFEFGARHFGSQVATNFFIPVATGIWAGGARRLLLRYAFPALANLESEHGSVVRALLAKAVSKLVSKFTNLFSGGSAKNEKTELVSFPGGMNFLPKSLLAETRKLFAQKNVPFAENWNCAVNLLEADDFGDHRFKINNEEFDAVVLTVSPWKCPHLLKSSEKALAAYQRLTEIPTHSLVCVGIGGRGIATPVQGFGALAADSSTDLLGVLFLHSLFPGQAPEGAFLYRVMLGGDRNPHLCDLPDSDILELAKKRLEELGLLPAHTRIEFEHLTRWKNTLPLAVAGHDEVLTNRWKLEALCPGLFLAGNYLEGVSVSDCLLSAEQATSLLKKRFHANFR